MRKEPTHGGARGRSSTAPCMIVFCSFQQMPILIDAAKKQGFVHYIPCMVLDWFEYERDGKDIPKIHPTQKPVKVLKRLIEIFTDPGDVVIDPCFGSGSTARACQELGRNFY